MENDSCADSYRNGFNLLTNGIKKYIVAVNVFKSIQFLYQMYTVNDQNETILIGNEHHIDYLNRLANTKDYLNLISKLCKIRLYDMSTNIIIEQVLNIPHFIFVFKLEYDSNKYIYQLIDKNDFNINYFIQPIKQLGKTSIVLNLRLEYKQILYFSASDNIKFTNAVNTFTPSLILLKDHISQPNVDKVLLLTSSNQKFRITLKLLLVQSVSSVNNLIKNQICFDVIKEISL